MKLDDLNRDNIFKTPDNYFESFPDRLKDRLEQEETSHNTRVRMHVFYKYAAAASVAIILTIVSLNLFTDRSLSPEEMLADVSSQDLIEYLVSSDLSEDELLDQMDLSLIDYEGMEFDNYLLPPETTDEEAIDEMIDQYEIELQYL